MTYYLGVDAGGTKSKTRIVDQDDNVLGEGFGGGANPHNQPLEKVLSNIGLGLLSARKQVENQHNITIDQFAGCCIGMAGLDTDDDRDLVISGLSAGMLRDWCEPNKLLLVNDGFIGLRSASAFNYGVCIISGTGSNCYGISKDLEQAQAGDWGYLLGDQGSGYAMGYALLRHVMKEYDGRAETSNLSEKVLKHLNFSSHTEIINWMYGESIPVKEVAGLTKLFDDSELANNYIVKQVIDSGINAQQVAFKAVVNQLELDKTNFPVVLAGGLMNLNAGNYPQKLQTAIQQVTENAEVIIQTNEPVNGAISLAKEVTENQQNPLFQKFLVNW